MLANTCPLGCPTQSFLNICFNVPLNLSVNPLEIGWYILDLLCFTDNSLSDSLVISLTSCGPWSVKTSTGIPTMDHIPRNASAIVISLTLFRATASGYRVAWSSTIKTYLLLLFEGRVIGPMISTHQNLILFLVTGYTTRQIAVRIGFRYQIVLYLWQGISEWFFLLSAGIALRI